MIRSAQFDDVYFSADGGLAETHHVFMQGNDLPARWAGLKQVTIAETGFGTGLNFLVAWKVFEETATADQRLDFVSVEKFPLSSMEIRAALAHWRDAIGDYLDRFLDLYPIRVPGPHKLYISDRVTLTIWFGDVADVLPEWDFSVDAWFLDGFTPAKNPEMWTPHLYAQMARLSHPQTTYATFTAAGDVRRGLEMAGFSVEKIKGFGRKRDMIRGRFMGGMVRRTVTKPQSVAIIGGGLAGTALLWLCNYYGIPATLYEATDHVATGASGGRLGMVNPKLTAKPSAQSSYYTSAYAHALRFLPQIADIDFQQCGSLHLCVDDDKDRRFSGYINNLGWLADHIRREGADLFYPDAAVVSPFRLCRKLAEGLDVRYGHRVTNLDDLTENVVILANGFAAAELIHDDLPIHSVRGQVSWVKPQTDVIRNLCFGGYITPPVDEGYHILGSSFQPWDTDVTVRLNDHADNLDRYNQAMATKRGHVPLAMDDVVGGWAALRTSSKDRFPIVGKLSDRVYISTAHGSHGIISSLMAADILLSRLSGRPAPVARDVLQALDPKRFDKR